MGISGNMYCLIENYLMHITQYVHYNGCVSSTKPIKYGVPQGSILGPLFFILFMNDFSRASEILFTILFADDTSDETVHCWHRIYKFNRIIKCGTWKGLMLAECKWSCGK